MLVKPFVVCLRLPRCMLLFMLFCFLSISLMFYLKYLSLSLNFKLLLNETDRPFFFFSDIFFPWGVICLHHGVPIWQASALMELWPFPGSRTFLFLRASFADLSSILAATDQLSVSTEWFILFSSVTDMQSYRACSVFIFWCLLPTLKLHFICRIFLIDF